MNPHKLFAFLPFAILALASPLHALDGQGDVVFGSPESKDTGWKSFEVLTGGDSLGTLAVEGFEWPANAVNWDGLGAYRLNSDTLRVFINHEVSPNGSFSRVDLDIPSLRAWGKAGIPDNSFSNQVLPAQPVVKAVSRGWLTADGSDPLNRPCSANAWLADTFGPGKGFADDVYLTGEEAAGGNFWVMDLATRKLYECPDLGSGSWENATPIDTGRTDTIALILGQDAGSNVRGTASLKLYVGLKNPKGDFRQRNGLAGGTIYHWNPDGTSNTNGTVKPGGLFERGAGTRITGSWTASNIGAALLSKLEDVHVNSQLTSDGYGREVIIACQEEGLLLLDATDLSFVAGDLATSRKSDLTLVYRAGDILGFSSMDNVAWSANGWVYVNEDDKEGDIWRVDVRSLLASQAEGDLTPGDSQVTDIVDADESRIAESSGIIDISEMLGECPGTYFLTSGQNSTIANNQLAMLVAPQPITCAEIAVEQPLRTNIPDGGNKGFDKVLVGSNASLTFTIKNSGNSDLTGLVIAKDGPNRADFTVTTNPTAPVIGGGSTTFTVTFAPGSPGLKTAAIHIANNDADENPFDITLTGKGIPAPGIEIRNARGELLADRKSVINLGASSVGKWNKPTSITITNNGKSTLKNLSLKKTGIHEKDFPVSRFKLKSLAPGESTTLKLFFKPRAEGQRRAFLTIRSNDPVHPSIRIRLNGKGSPPEAAIPIAAASSPSHGSAATEVRVPAPVHSYFWIKSRKFKCLTIAKSSDMEASSNDIQVSGNLVDWFSGNNHTTVIKDNNSLLKVRDNTPANTSTKRYIRIRPRR